MKHFLYAAGFLALAACSGEEAAVPAEAPQQEEAGGTGAVDLSPLTAEDFDGFTLDGELGCAFQDTASGSVLMVGSGYVGEGNSEAAVKLDGTIERLVSRAGGGFETLLRGTSFEGAGLTVTLTRLSEQDLRAGQEGSVYPARLTASRTGGGEGSWEGEWSCGP